MSESLCKADRNKELTKWTEFNTSRERKEEGL